MEDWFTLMDERSNLSAGAVQDLHDLGFVVIPGPVAPDRLAQFAAAYDAAVVCAAADDIAIGSTTTRVNDFVNRGPEFDELYLYKPIFEACCLVIRQPFKLSTMHARTVRPYAQAQDLHVDFRREEGGWPMVGFIMMVDEFRANNGATRFVPGSHKWPALPTDFPRNTSADHEQVLACGPAGSIIIYNGSVRHGHAANCCGEPRRSIQGAFIRRDAESATNQAARILPETLGRVGNLAKYLLAV